MVETSNKRRQSDEKKGDRRSMRTDRLLKEALAELMCEKQFTDITVKEITSRADVNRSTFYLHFPDPYALLQKIEEDTIEDIKEMITKTLSEVSNSGSLLPMFRPMIDYIIENESICRSLFINNASTNFLGKVYNLVYETGMVDLRLKYRSGDIRHFDIMVNYIIYGLIGILKSWFETGMRINKEEFLENADFLAETTIRGFLGRGEDVA